MGIRSMNYLALHPNVELSSGVLPHLMDAEKTKTPDGQLFVFESNFTPMWARDGKGEHCVHDLESEIEIQRFLGTLRQDTFLMVRAGADAECGRRGEWNGHPFVDDAQVKKIEAEYDRLTNEEPENRETMTALAKCLAVLNQVQERPGDAADIVLQGYYNIAIFAARKALANTCTAPQAQDGA